MYAYMCRASSKGKQPAPYPGAWVEPDGRQLVPKGFPSYLALAFVVTVIIPSLVLLSCLLSSSDTLRALGCATLAPYLLVFTPQILLETKYLNRSFMTPVLPVLFAYYRIWQFVRSLGLVAHGTTQGAAPSAAGGAAPQHGWLLYYLLSLLCVWVFDTGCTMLWLPGMFEWQLQSVPLLTRLSNQRQQEKQQEKQQHARRKSQSHHSAATPENGGAAAQAVQPGSPAMAAKMRRKLRAAAADGGQAGGGSGDYDSYDFGM